MKTYIDHGNTINFEGLWIPKDPANTQYIQLLQELKEGKAELIPYIRPAFTWVEIRVLRGCLLAQSDWTALPDTQPKPNESQFDGN